MALESPLLKRMRSDEDMAQDSSSFAGPMPDRFATLRKEGHIGPLGETIGRALSNFSNTLSQRQSSFQNGLRADSERQATLYQMRTGQSLRPTPASPPAVPNFSNVLSGYSTATLRPTAAAGTAGASSPATGSVGLVPGMRTLDGRAGSLASGTGRFGENVYDNASIARLNAGAGPAMTAAPTQSGGTPGRVATTTPNAPINAQQVQVPTLVMPRTLSGDLEGAEKERQQRLGDIDSAMFNLRSRLNSRGRRELYSTLLGQQNQLTRDRIGQVTGLETTGAQMANQASIEQAKLGTQVGEGNANRALDADRINSDAALRRESMLAEAMQPKATLRDLRGATSLLRNDGTIAPLTGADGQPFVEAIDGDTVTNSMLYQAFRNDIGAINENALLKPEERAAMLQEVEARPEYQRVLSSLRKPTLRHFLEAAKQANPGATELDLTNFYRHQYESD